jgi:hypothetical protein
MAIEDDWEERARKELDCAKKTSCAAMTVRLVNYCVEIRCQDTTSEV